MPNALARETSPYLRQHQDNPVDWLPWGPEALARAREEDKPLLVSIGYSACHWCHVMERECFESIDIADVMNEHFVCIKVDREERPDVDAIYMEAVQAMTGHGGWPLHAFLTPDGVPFYGGTYFPPEPRRGVPSWPQVCLAIARAWREDRERIVERSAAIVPRLAGAAALRPTGEDITAASLEHAVAKLRKVYDARDGGFSGPGKAPKFPMPSVIEFLLRRGETEMSLHTLRRMACGGMYDQIGGGFARYSTDAQWVVPHFEKMLCDNALLARAYLHAYQVAGDPLFRSVCIETIDWAARELRQPHGGFASALDADTGGTEGAYYTWTPEQVRRAFNEDEQWLASAAIEHFGVTEEGNFDGRSVLVRATDDPPEREELKHRLFAYRGQFNRPALDDKCLTAWNALMISALAEAGIALRRGDYVEHAVACAEFVWSSLRDADGRLLRTHTRGEARLAAYLEDHAFLLEAMLTLYEATFEVRWFDAAVALAGDLLTHFHDPEHGGFFSTADDHEPLIARRKDLEDSPIPAGASSAALGLLRLHAFTGEARYEDAALGVLGTLHKLAAQHPAAFGHVLQAIDFHLARVREVALVAERIEDLERFLWELRAKWRPHVVVAATAGSNPAGIPLLEGRTPVDGKPAAYVCERFACRAPVTVPTQLDSLLAP